MYAVIESGGKQHKVEEGEVLQLEKLDAAAGDKVKFDKILLVGEGKSVKIGMPYVEGGQVEAKVLKQGRGDKVKIIKFNRRKHFKKQQGHRQFFTEGTELFTKSGLFYSRRIGVQTSSEVYESQLSENDTIEEKPSSVPLLNASKVSGRLKNGLGIGVFNAITAEQRANAIDEEESWDSIFQSNPEKKKGIDNKQEKKIPV